MLTGKQKRYLRGEASLLKPAAYIGKEGLTDEVLKEIKTGLKANELIKLRVGNNAPVSAREASTELALGARCEVIQVIGHNIVLFRMKSKESKFKLP